MRVIGFNLETKSMRYTVLEGTKAAPVFMEKDRIVINATTSIPALMDWFESSFQNLINRVNPEIIGCKISLKGKKHQIPFWYYPYGILNNIAHKQGIDVSEFTSGNFTASKFGLPKTTNIYTHIDATFGTHPPHWDKNQKYSLLAAWMMLD
jgi:hypothetical protein